MRRRSAATPAPMSGEQKDGDEESDEAGEEAGELEEHSVSGLA